MDAIDATIVLDFGGDRIRALRELAEQFGLNKPAERRAMAALLFRMIRRQATQEEIETAAFAEGARLGLSNAEVCHVANWVATQDAA